MDLILWRHAEAEDVASSDLARPLTAKGKRQARRMAEWLHNHVKPKKSALIASGAKRSQQTLAAFSNDYRVDSRLNPGCLAQDYLDACHDDGVTIIVGHQPEIGRVASLLLTGREVDWEVKKGAVWWLQYRIRDGQPQYLLRAMMTPQMLGK